jgi:site-specific recombinase XerD
MAPFSQELEPPQNSVRFSNLVQQGHDIETVQQLLGHAELDHVLPYLAVSERRLRQMFCEVL